MRKYLSKKGKIRENNECRKFLDKNKITVTFFPQCFLPRSTFSSSSANALNLADAEILSPGKKLIIACNNIQAEDNINNGNDIPQNRMIPFDKNLGELNTARRKRDLSLFLLLRRLFICFGV